MSNPAQSGLFDEPEGFRRKADGQARLAWKDPKWMDLASAAIRRLAATGNTFTIDDLREVLQTKPKSANAYGTAFSHAERRGEIVVVSMTHSKRPEAKGRRIMVWRAAK